MVEVPHQLMLEADRQIRGFCVLRRDLTIPGKHKLASYLHRTVPELRSEGLCVFSARAYKD